MKERSPQHCGTMVFDIVEKPKLKLRGEYWTGRKTTGQIEMNYWKKRWAIPRAERMPEWKNFTVEHFFKRINNI